MRVTALGPVFIKPTCDLCSKERDVVARFQLRGIISVCADCLLDGLAAIRDQREKYKDDVKATTFPR